MKKTRCQPSDTSSVGAVINLWLTAEAYAKLLAHSGLMVDIGFSGAVLTVTKALRIGVLRGRGVKLGCSSAAGKVVTWMFTWMIWMLTLRSVDSSSSSSKNCSFRRI